MNSFLPTLLLVPALAATAVAGSSDDAFLELDRELAQIGQQNPSEGLRTGALLRAVFDHADDDLSLTGDDVSGFRLYDAQLWVDARIGAYEVFIKTDAGETTAFPPIAGDGVTAFTLRDAWARTELTEGVNLYWGQFKCPLVASANVGDGRLAMIDRTRIGQLFSAPGAYQPGAAVTGDFGDFHVKFAYQNGADGITDGKGIVVRGEYKIGAGAKHREGALGAPEELNATFGLGYFKDDSDIGGSDFGRAIAADAYVTAGRFSAQAEILDADEEFAMRALGNLTDDATPWDVTVGYLFADQYEGFLRYQDLDNEVSATIFGGGVNYYVMGHQTKWQLNVSRYDDDNVDGTIVQLGLAIGLSEPE
jgi:hypothetical protein